MKHIILFALLCSLTIGIYAQEDAASAETSALLKLLQLVPDQADTRTNLVSYADLRAAETLHPDAGVYTSAAEYLADTANESATLWRAALPADINPAMTTRIDTTISEMAQYVGFEFFAVDQTLQFRAGLYPAAVVAGTLDASSIDAALRARSYVPQPNDNALVWCGPVGCANGADRNDSKRNSGNIFGGELGQEHPIALIQEAGLIVASPVYEIVQSSVLAYTDAAPSLADVPAYQAVADVLTDAGTLRSLSLVPQEVLVPPMMMFMMPAPSGDPLPLFELSFIADVVTEESQGVLIGMVYATEAEANTAAGVIAGRIIADPAISTRASWNDLIAEAGATVGQATVITTSTDEVRYVAVLPLTYGLPADTSTLSGSVYRLLLQGLQGVDLPWLAGTP